MFTNWRGVVAPPEISDTDKDRAGRCPDADARQPGVEGCADQERLDRCFLAGDEFGTFLTEQRPAVETTLGKLGLA